MRPDFLELGLHDVGQSAVVTGRDAFRLTSSHYTATNTLFVMKKKKTTFTRRKGGITYTI